MTQPLLETVATFARKHDVSRSRVRSAIAAGQLPTISIGRAIRIDVAELPEDFESYLRADAIVRQGRTLVTKVYFIQAESGPIKIGLARSPESRLVALQSGNWERLNIAATVAGGPSVERAYHARFAEHRLHGEWFDPHPDILAEIERINAKPNPKGN